MSNDEEPGMIFSRGTVALLLADIEGSTGLWEAHRDAMLAATARLDELVAELVERHFGARPLEQGEGDSFVAGFARASDAVMCATELQIAFAREPWPEGIDLRVRIALHAGEVHERDDGRYVGPAFNRCARLRSLAHGGQTLLSRAVHDLAADASPTDMTFVDLGEHRLRDLARPERVYQIVYPGLNPSFPPLRSLTSVPNNLPVALTSFVGRELDAADVKRMIDWTRMLTVTGAGGCGKTRLVLEVAADLVDRFPEGLWWIDLAPVADPALLPSTVASCLGVSQVQGEEPIDTLVAQLGERRMLLVLDNCEHLVSACAELATQFLTKCPDVSVLATSREPLGVEGESTLRIPSLGVPEAAAGDVEDVRCESVELFVDRARSARPNFRLTNENAESIAQIVRRLDGIPLAIELAAARVRLLSPGQIAAGLSDRFHVLIGGARTALPRQRTLEASVDWSYQLLDEGERLLLGRLSVFAGSFDLDAAEAVCAGGGIEQYGVLSILSGLTEKSLVQVEEPDRDARYRLLETIRAYARQRLSDTGEAGEVRTEHLAHYLAVAERGETGLQSAAIVSWTQRLAADLDNLRAAMDHALATGQSDMHLRLTSALLRFWIVRGLYSEIRSSMEAALGAAGGDSPMRARALAAAALVSVMAGHLTTAVALAKESVALARQTEDQPTLARGLLHWGWSEFLLGEGGIDHVEEGARLAELTGDDDLIETALIYRGVLTGFGVDMASGRPHLEKALARAERRGNMERVGISAFFAGFLEMMAGRFREADSLFGRSLEASEILRNSTFTCFALSDLAWLAVYRGEYGEAKALIDQARREASKVGGITAANPEIARGWLSWAMGDLEAAMSVRSRALDTVRDTGMQLYVATALWSLGGTSLALGDLPQARAWIEEGESLARRARYLPLLVPILQERARLLRTEGDLEAAEAVGHEALRESTAWGSTLAQIDCLELLAGIAVDIESWAEAARLFAAAQQMRDDIGYRRFPIHEGAYSADVAAAREALGEESAARWSEGETMSTEEAIAYAVRGRGERKRPSAGWASLTPSEQEVVRLVAEGLPNPEIAEKLFVTRNTVKTHLKHIFGKLGISTRAELAAEATRRGR